MKLVLDDRDQRLKFAPLCLTRPIAELRVGIYTNSERYKAFIPNCEVYFGTESFLAKKYPNISEKAIHINACIIPNSDFIRHILNLKDGQTLVAGNKILASYGEGELIEYAGEEIIFLNERWDLFILNGIILEQDFKLATKDRKSEELSETNTVIGDREHIFLEEGAKVEASVLNVSDGFIYVGKNAEIMEGSLVRGSLALCEGSALKLGTKVYGPCTLGPYSKVGGEINNVLFQGYSNKGHDGFLGNSLIGEWCNIGADSNSSNLKNNYGKIRTWSYEAEREIQTDLTFMGLAMGDHSKCSINTMFNTASVVGVCTNIFSSSFPPKYLPSFSWGESEQFEFDRAINSINGMMQRRGKILSDEDLAILQHIFNHRI